PRPTNPLVVRGVPLREACRYPSTSLQSSGLRAPQKCCRLPEAKRPRPLIYRPNGATQGRSEVRRWHVRVLGTYRGIVLTRPCAALAPHHFPPLSRRCGLLGGPHQFAEPQSVVRLVPPMLLVALVVAIVPRWSSATM